MARVMPRVESIPTAAMPMPNSPALTLWAPPLIRKLNTTTAPTMSTGSRVESIPSDRPSMTTVAGPVSAESASFWVGR